MNCSKEIGGFFGLELPPPKRMLDDRAVRLNSGRNCLRHLIRARGIRDLRIPYFTCPVVWEAAMAEGCRIGFYPVNDQFMPLKEFPRDTFVLYTNYFGVCSGNVAALARQYPNLIVDNAQAFYMPPVGMASFYSPRKFFGVPDGGILYAPKDVTAEALPKGESYHRCSHLLKRLDLSAHAAYADFQSNDEALGHEPVQSMSHLTERLLTAIDHDAAREKRLANFSFLHARLGRLNQLDIRLGKNDVPMAYPFRCDDPTLRNRLLAQKIYVAKYWPGMETQCPPDALELRMRDEIIPLPCDQRYSTAEMTSICSIVLRLK